MAREPKPTPTPMTAHPSSFLALLTGWVQQGVESFFATQRVLVDVAMRQNAIAMKSLREGLSDPEHSPLVLMTELAVEGTTSFMEAQKILLNLAQHENELTMNAMKERVAGSPPAMAMTDLVRRSVHTFLGMQHEFLKITSKHTLDYLDATRKGKDGNATHHLVESAREAMEHFVHAQQKFLDIVAEETTHATSGKTLPPSKMKQTELAKLARDASNAFVDAQKKLLDVVGQQVSVNLKTATRMLEVMSPSRLWPMAAFTGAGVRNFVAAEKAVIDTVMKTGNGRKPTPHRRKRHGRPRKMTMAAAAS